MGLADYDLQNVLQVMLRPDILLRKLYLMFSMGCLQARVAPPKHAPHRVYAGQAEFLKARRQLLQRPLHLRSRPQYAMQRKTPLGS